MAPFVTIEVICMGFFWISFRWFCWGVMSIVVIKLSSAGCSTKILAEEGEAKVYFAFKSIFDGLG